VSDGRILILDDDSAIGDLIVDVVADMGFQASSVTRYDDFEKAYQDMMPTIIFLDLQMPDIDGMQVLGVLSDLECTASIFLMSGMDARVLKAAKNVGRQKGLKVDSFLMKPLDIDDLEGRLHKFVKPERRKLSSDDVRGGLERREFVVHYQPKVSVSKSGAGHVEAAEALVRWQHPELGFISPGDFIPLVEQSGMISDLTRLVFEEAINQSVQWRDNGLHIRIAINLSPLMLDMPDLPDVYAQLVTTADLSPGMFQLEITETAVMEDVLRATEILTRFRMKGFGLSIDDFGTGYSSLIGLVRLPFDELKIDRAFVDMAPEDAEGSAIVKITCQLAKELGLKICAEGCERSETLNFLMQSGCDTVQGFFFSKPLPADAFVDFVWQHNESTSARPMRFKRLIVK